MASSKKTESQQNNMFVKLLKNVLKSSVNESYDVNQAELEIMDDCMVEEITAQLKAENDEYQKIEKIALFLSMFYFIDVFVKKINKSDDRKTIITNILSDIANNLKDSKYASVSIHLNETILKYESRTLESEFSQLHCSLLDAFSDLTAQQKQYIKSLTQEQINVHLLQKRKNKN